MDQKDKMKIAYKKLFKGTFLLIASVSILYLADYNLNNLRLIGVNTFSFLGGGLLFAKGSTSILDFFYKSFD